VGTQRNIVQISQVTGSTLYLVMQAYKGNKDIIV